MAFTKLQRKFINIYSRMLINPEKKPNGTKAAIDAGYSKNGASVAAAIQLGKIKVREEIEKRVHELNQEMDKGAIADAQEVLEYMTRAKRFKQTENWTDTQAMKSLEQLEKNADLIESIKVTTKPDGTVTQEIKTVSKAKMIELFAKHHKLLTEVHEHKVDPVQFEYDEES